MGIFTCTLTLTPTNIMIWTMHSFELHLSPYLSFLPPSFLSPTSLLFFISWYRAKYGTNYIYNYSWEYSYKFTQRWRYCIFLHHRIIKQNMTDVRKYFKTQKRKHNSLFLRLKISINLPNRIDLKILFWEKSIIKYNFRVRKIMPNNILPRISIATYPVNEYSLEDI